MSSGSIIGGVVKGVAVVCAIIVLLVVLSFAWFMFVFAEDAQDPSQARFGAVLLTLIAVGAFGWGVYAFFNPRYPAEAGPAQGGERSDRRTCATCGQVFQDKDYLNEPVPERYTCTRCGVADGP